MEEKKIWFCSDWHFCHQKEFLWKDRGFNSVEEHCEEIVRRHNSLVSDEDEVYVLGDLMLNDNEKGLKYIKRMKGNLHIILGNHDTGTRIQLYRGLPQVKMVAYATIIKYRKAHFYLSHYPTLTANYDDDKPWHKNLISIHGHTHQTMNFMDENNPYMYHVGLDSHNCYPIEINDVMEEIRQKRTELNNKQMAM